MGQQLQCHVLKGQGGAVEQLQHMGVVVQLAQGSHRGIIELGGGIGSLQRRIDLRNGEVLQVGAQNGGSTLAVVHLRQLGKLLPGDLREHGGYVQAAIGGQAVEDRLGCGDACAATGGEERHGDQLLTG